MRGTRTRSANALHREIVVRAEEVAGAPASVVYGLLADLRSHLEWAGERQSWRSCLLSIDAPDGPARVGTEFRSTGTDPVGTFDDRSVVTEATPGRAFEFVTDALLLTKRGKRVEWTNVHRYEIHAEPGGCRVVSTIRIVRISELAGVLVVLRIPGLRALAIRASAGAAASAVRNLAGLAEEIHAEGG
jgi:hypothetical protein